MSIGNIKSKKLIRRNDFIWQFNEEPHKKRRRDILNAHPEIKQLFGHEWKSKYICLFLLVLPQIWLSYVTQDLSWPKYLFICYVFGATITQSLFLAIHELSHNLFFLFLSNLAVRSSWQFSAHFCAPRARHSLRHDFCARF